MRLRIAVSAVLMLLALAIRPAESATARPHATGAHPAAALGEYAPYDSAGTCEITGTSAIPVAPAVHPTLARRTVLLRPATSWANRWWTEWAVEGSRIRQPDAATAAHMRQVVADSAGRFRFAGLPPGNYYLLSSMTWTLGGPGANDSQFMRVVVGKPVMLAAGEHASVVLDSLRSESVWAPLEISVPSVPDSVAWNWGQ